MRVSIFGLGYVGVTSLVCLAHLDHRVIGIDINPEKVTQINDGVVPFQEPELQDMLEVLVAEDRVRATILAQDAIDNSDISFICVGTPSTLHGDIDLTYIERVGRNIGAALRNKGNSHIVVVRSTVFPGTTDEVLIPALEATSGKKADVDFDVCVNPEFLREGNAVWDFYHPSRTVIGTRNSQGGNILTELYAKVEGPTVITGRRMAEMVKYADNAFHALKVSFSNEIGQICKAVGIDGQRLMEIFVMDKRLNLSSSYLRPGFAFGGSCLPKDLRALIYRARHLDVDVPLLESVITSNETHIRFAIDMILRTGKRKVGFLGLSFKIGTDDLRESPTVDLIERLLGKGYQVLAYEPNLALDRLIGSNRAFVHERIPHLAAVLAASVQEVLEQSEVIVLTKEEPAFRAALEQLLPKHILIDFVGVGKSQMNSGGQYAGICW